MLASPACRLLLATLVAGCVPGKFDHLESGGGYEARDAAAQPDAGAHDAGVADAAPPGDASEADVDAGAQTRSIPLTDDRDDGIFCVLSGQLDEKLHYTPEEGAADYTLEVGVDSEQCRSGLRFTLPVARGAHIESAVLTLYRVGPADNIAPASTMRVQVYQGSTVAQFDDAHQHDTPAQHDPAGLWATAVGGWAVGDTMATTDSPDLRALVQHVVDQAGWQPNHAVTFLISDDMMSNNEYVQFQDAYAMDRPPVLTLVYR
jgi:hypothetical protein